MLEDDFQTLGYECIQHAPRLYHLIRMDRDMLTPLEYICTPMPLIRSCRGVKRCAVAHKLMVKTRSSVPAAAAAAVDSVRADKFGMTQMRFGSVRPTA